MDENHSQQNRRKKSRYGGLTTTQLNILAECASGGSVKTVSASMKMSYDATAWHVRESKKILHASTISQACVLAISQGLISGPTGIDLKCFPLFESLQT